MSLPTAETVAVSDQPRTREPIVRWHPGWVILFMAAVGVFMSAPGQSYSVAAFIDPMLASLTILRTEYSSAYLVATLLGGLTLPYIGRLLDRYGARVALPVVAVLLGGACMWMSRIEGIIGLYIGFAMIRCLGQGTLTLISNWMVGEWFVRRRGLATGLVGLGGTFSVMAVPQLNELFITDFGWRTAWMILAATVWIVLVIPGILFVRNRPEDLGLLPDGEHAQSDEYRESNSEVQPKTAHAEQVWTVDEACRTFAFWQLAAVVATCSLIGTGLVFHQVSLLAEHNVSRAAALGLIAAQAVVGTITSVLAGYLTDRMEARYLLAAAMLFLAGALLLLLFLPSPAFALIYAGLLGLQGGIIRSTGTVVWLNFYGRANQGAIRGLAFSIMVIAAAFGPLPLSLAKDYLGDYRLALGLFLILPVLSGFAVLRARVPTKP